LRILIISQYFWPETFRVNELVKYLKDNNYQVDILTGTPNYPEGKIFSEYKLNKKNFETYYGSPIFRVPIFLRRDGRKLFLFLNYISFILSSIIYGSFLLRNKKYDIIFSFATSPLTSSLSAIFFSKIKSCKSFIWVLDIWPDILLELKIIKNVFIYKVISRISKFIYKNFDYILSQSKSFQKKINLYNNNNNNNNNNIYFPAWAENIKDYKSKETKYNEDKSFKIVFTGNVGEAQNFDEVIKAAVLLKNYNDIKWIIVGSGRELEKIKSTILKEDIKNFILEGKKPIEDMSYYHSIADVLFISLKSGSAISSTIPGKLQTYLQSNKFILGMIEGEGKKIIEESGIGLCVNPNNPKNLAEKILYLKDNPKIIKKINNSNLGKEYLKKNFDKNLILEKLLKNFQIAYDNIEKIKLIKNASQIPFHRNFSLSGLNLAFLGYLKSGDIKLHNHLVNWPDGIFKSRFYGFTSPKVSGLNIIKNLEVPDTIENVYVLGVLTARSKDFLSKKLRNIKLIHIDLPYDKIENIYKFCPKNFTNKDLIICTLPTPKQEQLSELIIKNNKFFKIICIGGAVAMASGDEKTVPLILDRFNLEFLWRLRTDTNRRIIRLIYSFCSYIYGELTFRYKRIKFIFLC
jgi:glycosyltransferase involved in cell wall biosynthesis